MKRTVIVHGLLAMRGTRLAVARRRETGTQVLAIEHVASRLAGGFIGIADLVTLRETVSAVLANVDLGELEPIKSLPGFPRAAAASLMKLWMSGIRREALPDHPRIQSILALDEAVRERLPATARPHDEVIRIALDHLHHAPKVIGPVTVEGMTELHVVWRNLLIGLADHVPVTWNAGPRAVPEWLAGTKVRVETSAPSTPRLSAVSCATARHEALEAIRWARSLMAMGISAGDIAIATTATAEYDDQMVALASDAGLPIHFVHGLTAMHTAEGQAAAALADLLLRGLSQKRVRRLFSLIRRDSEVLSALPDDWDAILPVDAALTTIKRWKQVFDESHRGEEIGKIVLPVLEMIDRGVDEASEIGERLLSGRTLALWERALINGPPTALDQTLESLRVDDGADPFTSCVFMSAESLATQPRKYVRLMGLSSRAWPRGISEDALIPSHVISARDLDPLPLEQADRRDFTTILATTTNSVVLSWPRRDEEGRALGISTLVPENLARGAKHLGRVRRASHAMSEADRLLARPDEFAMTAQARSADACWRDWHSNDVTPHDGLVRPDHPRIRAALAQFHSTTSLKLLLRNPLGFVWQYALGFNAPDFDDEPLTIDSIQFGNLVHDVLRRTVESLAEEGNIPSMSEERIRRAVDFAAGDTGAHFQISQPVPAELIWRSTMQAVVDMAEVAMLHNLPSLPDQQSFAEVPFGGGHISRYRGNSPWDPDRPITIPGTDIKIRGYIDRMDISGDGTRARVTDYKSGRVPKDVEKFVIDGGQELQRCLYGFAVRALLGEDITIESGLLYPRGKVYAPLENADEVLDRVATFVKEAADGLRAGRCLPGIDAKNTSDLGFALPANAEATYLKQKNLAILQKLGDAAQIWSEP